MKRTTNAVIICLLAIILLLPLQGCSERPPITFSSVMTIQTDESGSRVIQASANKNTLQALFGRGSFSFQSFVSANCPEELEWTYVETSRTYDMTFTLSFNTLDEYKEKLESICNVPDCVYISRPEVGVKTGFTLSEKVDLMQIFSWFTDALMERTGKSESELQSYVTAGNNELYYGARLCEQKDGHLYCYIENLLDAERIDILTGLSLGNSWSRTVCIVFPDEMLDNASNVKTYLSSLLPEGIKESWKNNTTWVLEFPPSDLKQLGELTNGLFQNSGPQAFHEEISARDAMCIDHNYSETFNFTFFVPDSGVTDIRYFLSGTENAEIDPYDTSGKLLDFPSAVEGYEGYTCVFDRTAEQTADFDYRIVFKYQPDKINVDTTVEAIQLIKRKTSISVPNVPALHQSYIIDTISRNAKGYGLIRQDMKQDDFTLVFIQTGIPGFIADGFSAVFNGSETLDYYSKALPMFSGTHYYGYTDSLDFSGFLHDPGITEITCCTDFPRNASIETVPADGASIDGSQYCITVSDSSLSVDLDMSVTNPAYFWCVLVLLTLVSAVLYSLYKLLTEKNIDHKR